MRKTKNEDKEGIRDGCTGAELESLMDAEGPPEAFDFPGHTPVPVTQTAFSTVPQTSSTTDKPCYEISKE